MPVGVIDVGSNTVRLHVSGDGGNLAPEKAMLRLGESIERFGAIPETKLTETANCVAGFVQQARRLGVGRLEVLVTSPGRQAKNCDELLDRLAAASGVPVRLLSSVEEGRLAFLGTASATRGPSRRLIAVCDVGGGSAQISVGTRRSGPAWVRSIDIGSMRLTARLLNDDPPGDVAVQAARVEVDHFLEGVVPPLPETVYAVGGSARALRSILGAKLGVEELHEATVILAHTPGREIVELYGIDPERVRTLAAGAIILGAICERLGGLPLRVVRGGVREGAASELASTRAAA